MLRYQESNELHRDFHGGTNLTVDYIAKKYGPNTLKMILRRTGRNVYKSIHDKLAAGNASELIEHLNWFLYREQGKYQLRVTEDEIILEIFEWSCNPASEKTGASDIRTYLPSDKRSQCRNV